MQPINIALDYDETYTADPDLWLAFVQQARARNHNVFVVTMRYASEAAEIDTRLVKLVNGVIPTGRQIKKPFVEKMGLFINIWIDDHPEWVVDTNLVIV